MQVGKLGAAARKTMRPFFVWWVARCFLSIGLWGFGPVGQICKCSKYTSVYMYTFVFICRILGIPWHTGEYPWRRPCFMTPLHLYKYIFEINESNNSSKSCSFTFTLYHVISTFALRTRRITEVCTTSGKTRRQF